MKQQTPPANKDGHPTGLSVPTGSAPTLCPACEQIIKDSNLVWKRVGGLSVGYHTQPWTWVLRDKYSFDMCEARAKELQRLTGAIRYLHATLPHLPEELKVRVERFLSPQNVPNEPRG